MLKAFLDWPGWIHVILAESALGLLFAASFVVRYHYRTGGAWRGTSEGRWMLYGRLLIASVLALTLVNNLFRSYPGQRFVSFLFFTVYVAHLYWPHLLLSRAQRKESTDVQAGNEDQSREPGNVPRVPGRVDVARHE